MEQLGAWGRFSTRPGLHRMRALLEFMHCPVTCPVVLVAGTVGKGSTIMIMEAVLRAAGLDVGTYISPHLLSYRERIRISGQPVEEEQFAAHLKPLLVAAAGMDEPPTQFELLTALALSMFQQRRPSLILMEVGLGGRLDATNVLEPCLSVITRIDRDHTAQLGETVEEIAVEKAGITRPGVPMVVAANPPAVIQVLADIAARDRIPWRGVPPAEIMDGDPGGQKLRCRGGSLALGLPGPFQAQNAATALAAIDLLREMGHEIEWDDLERGLREVRFPGRLECINRSPWVVLDGAHNPVGMEALCAALSLFPHRRLLALVAAMDDKDYPAMLKTLAGTGAIPTFTTIGNVRSAQPDLLAGSWPGDQARVGIQPNPHQALVELLNQAQPEDLVLVTGSLYLVGAARDLLLGGEDDGTEFDMGRWKKTWTGLSSRT